MSIRDRLRATTPDRINQIVKIVGDMGTESYYALNAQVVLFENQELLDHVELYLMKCREARGL